MSKILLAMTAVRAAVFGLALVVVACNAGEQNGPVDIVWDRESCAECRMLVGEPKFAAQLQTIEGDVLKFDDPGCLLRYAAQRKPQTRATYFHHLQEDRWLSQQQVGFVPASPSPMGYGLGAMPRETKGALSFKQATAQVLGAAKGPP